MSDRLVKKVCGADIELGNLIEGIDREHGTGHKASNLLLDEIEGLPLPRRFAGHTVARTPTSYTNFNGGGYSSSSYSSNVQPYYGGGSYYNPQDQRRRFLPSNGGCIYIDLDHLEVCLPEVISAYDHVAAWHAMLRLANQARIDANAKLPDGQEICVLANNSDGKGNSYGSHLDFLISRHAWKDIFHNKPHYLLFLASFQVSSIVYTGQGKVGSENGAPYVPYQLAQRADFFETLFGNQTTFNRPIVNARDEALCGTRGGAYNKENTCDRLARLHVIFFDSTLSHVSSLLKVGVKQIILTMIEADRVGPHLLLDDPLEAIHNFSHDPSLEATAQTISGQRYSAVDLQLAFLDEAKRFVEEGHCEGIVPEAEAIIALWEDTLLKLRDRDFDALTSRLDWVLKRAIIERAMEQRPELTWDSPEIKHLDHLYSLADPERGLFWSYFNNDLLERVVSDDRIDHFVHNPPEDTRAWTRAMFLRSVEPESIAKVDWDSLQVREEHSRFWNPTQTITLEDPTLYTREDTEAIFDDSPDTNELIEALQELGGNQDDALHEDGDWVDNYTSPIGDTGDDWTH